MELISSCVGGLVLGSEPNQTSNLRSEESKALKEYGGLVTAHNQAFDAKWIQGKGGAKEPGTILGNPDASSLVDLGSSYAVIRQMSIVPLNKQMLISLGLAAVLPMVPVILLTTPVDEIVHTVLKMLS